MRSRSGQNGRRLHLILAVVAAIGLEFDVFCNPFAPTFIIHWIMSSTDDPREAPATESGEANLCDSTDASAGLAEPGRDGPRPAPAKGRSRFVLTAEISEAIGIRPPARVRSPLLNLALALISVSPPRLEPIIQRRESLIPVTAHLSIQSQLCRFRC